LGGRKGIGPVKKLGGWWRWVLVSPDGVVPIRMVGMSATVNFPLHHEVQKFSSGAGSPGWCPEKRAVKWLWWCGGVKSIKRKINTYTVIRNQTRRTTTKFSTVP